MPDTKTKTMREFYIQYYSKTLLTIGDLEELQQTPLPLLRVDFGDTTVVIQDCVRLEGADKLPAGLEFIVHMCATNEEEAKEKSNGFVEVILNFLSLSMLCSCDAAKIINVIELKMDTNISPLQYYIYPFENDFISWSLVKIDTAIFVEVWNNYDKNEHQKRLGRAMSWFRTGLNKKGLDEFISYWVGVEILSKILKGNVDMGMKEELNKGIISKELIKNLSLSSNAIITKEKDGKWIISDGTKDYDVMEKRGQLNIYMEDEQGCRKRITDDWVGAKKVFEDKLQYDDFSKIKRIRNEILHGYKELSNEFVKEAKEYTPLMRKGLVACISTILDVSDEIFSKVVNKDIRRVELERWQVVKGNIENLPSTFDEMIIDYPKIKIIKNKKISRVADGKLNIEYTFKCEFHDADTKFGAEEAEIWGDQHSGVGKEQIEIKEISRGREWGGVRSFMESRYRLLMRRLIGWLTTPITRQKRRHRR